MRISGFNYVGKLTTTSTADKDPVHVIYVLDNNICIAICRSRYKRETIPWYIAYGYNPFTNTYVTRYILDCQPRFETYQEAKEFVETTFREYHPDVLVNNHIANRVANVYSQYCTIPTGVHEDREYGYGRVYREYERDFYAPLTVSVRTTFGWYSAISENFKKNYNKDTAYTDLNEFFEHCRASMAEYADRFVTAYRAVNDYRRDHPGANRWENDGNDYCRKATNVVGISLENTDELIKLLTNEDGYAEEMCDPND